MSEDTTVLDRDTTTDTTQSQDTSSADTTTDQSTQDTSTTQTTDDSSSSSQQTTDDAWWKPYAGDDPKLQENMSRFTDPKALFEAYDTTRQALRDSGRVVIPGDDADEQTLSVWNRTVGVPEKYDGYKIEFEKPEGFEQFTGQDAEVMEGITKSLHEAGGIYAHPGVVSKVHEIAANLITEQGAQMLARNTQALEDSVAYLKSDSQWGAKNYDRNVNYANQAIGRFGPKDEAEKLKEQYGVDNPLKLRLEDGTSIGALPYFVKMFASMGAEVGDDPVWTEAARHGGNPGQTLEAEKEEIMALRAKGDWEGYAAKQERLEQINAALARHKSSGRG